MNNEIRELKKQVERLRTIAIDLKVDLNIRDGEVRELQHQLAKAYDQERSTADNTQTIDNLKILGDSDDDNGQDPRDTGRFKNPWEGVR